MKDIIPYLIIVVLGVLLFYCYSQEPETVIETVTEIRTVTRIDTVFIEKTVYVDLPIPPPDTVYINGEETYKYTTEHSDTLIDAVIRTWSKGEIVKQEFDYTPRFPKYITRTDSVFVDKVTTITRTRYPSGLFIGAETVLIADQFDFSPKVQWVRRDFAIGYRYGINTNSHNLSLMIKL